MLTIMFMWFHWCSCGFIYAPVVSFTVCSCGFMMFMWFHWCSLMFMFMWFHLCSCGFIVFMGHQFSMICECICEIHESLHGRDCIDVYMWLKGPPPRSFWSSQLLHQTILSYEPMSHPSKLIKCNKGLSKVGLSLKYIKVQRKYGLIAPHDVEKFWSIYNIDKFV